MAPRDTSLRRNRVSSRAIRLSENNDLADNDDASQLPLTTLLVLCGLISTLLLLTSP
jgi:hypothetical protein